MTNFTHTYAVFTYLCGDMQWSSVGENNSAVVGFNAMGEFFYNHPQSGTQNIADAVSCVEHSQRSNCINDMESNTIIMMVTQFNCDNITDDEKRLICNCESRLENDISFDVDIVVGQLYPCPPTLEQARADAGRFVLQNNTFCYVSRETVIVDGTCFTQQCCYLEDKG